jgi:hypothetical protein
MRQIKIEEKSGIQYPLSIRPSKEGDISEATDPSIEKGCTDVMLLLLLLLMMMITHCCAGDQ